MKRWLILFCLVFVPVLMAKEAAMKFTLTSKDFSAGGVIPTEFTGDGADRSPELQWTHVPNGTKELALICEDPDAPQAEPWVHWLLYKIAATTTQLPQGVPTEKIVEPPQQLFQGKNSFGKIGYGGPLPPHGHGEHRYFFKLYALDTALKIEPGATKGELLHAMHGHIVAETDLVGRYER